MQNREVYPQHVADPPPRVTGEEGPRAFETAVTAENSYLRAVSDQQVEAKVAHKWLWKVVRRRNR